MELEVGSQEEWDLSSQQGAPVPSATLGKALHLTSLSFLPCRVEEGRGNLWLGVVFKLHLAKA